MINDDELILDFKDSDGKRYIFTKENYDKHKGIHPELLITNFLDRMKSAIINPLCIYPAYDNRQRFCYYYYEFEIEGIKRYTKVVVQKTKDKYIIITGFRPTNIKEEKYFKEPCKRP